jgi:hypothetical protein
MQQLIDHPFLLVLAVLVAITGVGRLTRVVTYDDYPPSAAFRRWWIGRVTRGNGWAKLADCLWCASPWLMLVCIGWLLAWPLSPVLVWAWWIFWSWLGLSYLAAILVRHDEPDEE